MENRKRILVLCNKQLLRSEPVRCGHSLMDITPTRYFLCKRSGGPSEEISLGSVRGQHPTAKCCSGFQVIRNGGETRQKVTRRLGRNLAGSQEPGLACSFRV